MMEDGKLRKLWFASETEFKRVLDHLEKVPIVTVRRPFGGRHGHWTLGLKVVLTSKELADLNDWLIKKSIGARTE